MWFGSLLPAVAPPSGGLPPARWEAGRVAAGAAWFGPVEIRPLLNMFLWRAAVRPPPGSSRLAVTLVFQEASGGFGRLIWQGSSRSVTVCGNLYEGAAPLMQRTILLDRETLGGPGTLIVETTGNQPSLLRAELAWVEPLVLAATGWTPPGLFLAPSGRILPEDDLRGEGRRALADEERGRVADAVLDAGPVRLEAGQGARFLVPLSQVPLFGRLEADVAGLAPGEVPYVWVNGRPLSGVSVQVPGLEDAGYLVSTSSSQITYAGWRKVHILVPLGVLRAGENQVDWQSVAGGSPHTLRNIRLQADYGLPAISAGAPASPGRAASPPSAAGRPGFRLGLSSGTESVGLRTE